MSLCSGVRPAPLHRLQPDAVRGAARPGHGRHHPRPLLLSLLSPHSQVLADLEVLEPIELESRSSYGNLVHEDVVSLKFE